MTGIFRGTRFRSLAAVTLALSATSASAETLREALAKAYQYNPTLNATRAGLRATDEQVPLTRAEGLPAVNLSGQFSDILHQDNRQLFTGSTISVPTQPDRNVSGTVQLSVPVYAGGSIRNSVAAAKLRVEAGQNNLRATESSLFANVVAAYMDVIRDSQVVYLNRQNVLALETNLRASSDRFEVGDLTRTDVAQSDSRLALARANLQTAEATLIGSKERYIALVGTPLSDPQTPDALPGLPESPELAVQIALVDNSDLLAAIKNRDAARYDLKSLRGRSMPRINGFVSGSYLDYLGTEKDLNAVALTTTPRTNKSATAGVQLSVPLYQGGRQSALSRQGVARESQAIEQLTETERSVISQVRSSYASWRAALETIASTRTAVKAAALSLEGVKAENSAGTRTILDILNAEQEALNARVQLVSAERNAYVAGFSLIAAMGHAEARDLNLDAGPLYDPNVNYRRAKNTFFDFDYGRDPQPVSTSTRDTPPQTSTVVEIRKTQ
ncbi:TolC family outer membrane protein [Sphingobium sufflavum]|uniref:TolC family outer membrane protein n=1 Tax=Sphingobium sufflavum TaxID=1129547 RepID=UPI001F28846E|nr:TolC family outer membrane protein [Sphingobium sufflavum]MCE7798540.1 TolC family outer membrane protein [Sphingobium sufflavum]